MNKMQQIVTRLGLAVMALGVGVASVGVASVHADDSEPIMLNPDGTAFVAEPAAATAPVVALPEAVADDDDPPIPPDAAEEDFYVYVSAPGSGTVAGIAYDDEDVLRHDTATGQWMKVFDGTNAGLPASADIDALDHRQPDVLGHEYYLSFDKPTAVPGLGTVDDSDIVLFTSFLGSSAWTMVFDGSAHGLTTDGEDVDGVDWVGNGSFLISTVGGYSVPKYPSGTLKGGDEDILTYAATYNRYILRLDGSAMGLAAGNDIRAFDFDRHFGPDRDWIFLSMEDPFTYKNGSLAASGAPNDIFVDERPNGGSAGVPRLGTVWDASAAGFPKVDALEMVEK
jgi:hypothetical protein